MTPSCTASPAMPTQIHAASRTAGPLRLVHSGSPWHMLTTGEIYSDLGGDYYQRRNPERQTKRLIAQLERLGHHVTLQQANAA